MDAQNPPAGIERAHDFGFCGSIDRLLLPLPCCGGALQLFRLVGQIYFLCLPWKALLWCPSSLQRQCLLSKHRYSHSWACPGAPVFLEALSVWCLLIVAQCNSTEIQRKPCVLQYFSWYEWIIIDLHLHLSLEETGKFCAWGHGHIAKISHSWGRSSFQSQMADSLRTGCTQSLSPLPELPKSQCVRPQIPSGM